MLSRIFGKDKKKSSGPLLDPSDLSDQLFSHAGSSLWLGRYPEARVMYTLEKYGITQALHRRGLRPPVVSIQDIDLFLQTLKIYEGERKPENLLLELRVRETALAPETRYEDGFGDQMPHMLAIEWLMMQNPRAEFRRGRPPLPGQQHPGLGISNRVGKMLRDLARRLGLEGIINRPAYFHNAWFFRHRYTFYDPRWEGLLKATLRDIGFLSSSEISWAFELGCIRRQLNGEIIRWEPGIQIFPLSRRVENYLKSDYHKKLRQEYYGQERFILDADSFRKQYTARLELNHGKISTQGGSRPERTRDVLGGNVAEDKSLFRMFRRIVSENQDKTAYLHKHEGTWKEVSWSEMEGRCSSTARALMALGLKGGDRACILSDTRLEWVQADFGIHGCGGVTVGIYPSNLPEDCAYIINHCEAAIIILENDNQLAKILSVREKVPKLKHIVVMDGSGDPAAGVMTWQQFLDRAVEISPDDFEARVEEVDLHDLASLVYTSGTTGLPKGAMLTHRNLLFAGESASVSLGLTPGLKTLMFLPLAHVFARLEVYFCIQNAVEVAFAESITQVGENLREIRPHFIASVPRIYEKVYDKIISGAQEAGGIKLRLFNWALNTGKEVSRCKQNKQPVPGLLKMKYGLAEKLVFKKIHAALGGRMSWAVSGAAPLNKTVAEFFHACGLLILEGLGMTENASFTNVNMANAYKFGTVGPTGPGIEMKTADDGEILFRGENVMKGYFKSPEATAEAIDADGWLHTGDVGVIDEDGFLRITDRKKDLIITAGGKNIAPQRIEQALTTSRFISQAMAFGDRRKYITALIALNLETVAPWAESKGVRFSDPSELADNPDVMKLITDEMETVNSSLASFETVKRIRILPRELSIEEGELTPSLKIKRRVVVKKFGDLLEEMYED